MTILIIRVLRIILIIITIVLLLIFIIIQFWELVNNYNNSFEIIINIFSISNKGICLLFSFQANFTDILCIGVFHCKKLFLFLILQ